MHWVLAVSTEDVGRIRDRGDFTAPLYFAPLQTLSTNVPEPRILCGGSGPQPNVTFLPHKGTATLLG
jgi:hypothetical protein